MQVVFSAKSVVHARAAWGPSLKAVVAIGCETSPEIADLLLENPHIRFSKNRRGYVRCVITPEQLRADFRVLPYVSRPHAPVQTAASFVVVDREPALQRVV